MNDKIEDIKNGLNHADIDKRRAYRYALALIVIGALLVMAGFVGEMTLVLLDVPGGLPESVTSGAFGAGNLVMGYGAGILPSSGN